MKGPGDPGRKQSRVKGAVRATEAGRESVENRQDECEHKDETHGPKVAERLDIERVTVVNGQAGEFPGPLPLPEQLEGPASLSMQLVGVKTLVDSDLPLVDATVVAGIGEPGLGGVVDSRPIHEAVVLVGDV